MRLGVFVALVCLACSAPVYEEVDGASGDGLQTDLEPSSGGMSETSAGGSSGGRPVSSGGTLSTGGVALGSGGETSVGGTGGAPVGGSASGGAMQMGGAPGTGGDQVPTETVLWSFSYSGGVAVAQQAEFVSSRVFLADYSCPLNGGIPIVPGSSGEFVSTRDFSCVDLEVAPVVRFGDHEWDADPLPDIDYSDPNLRARFVLNSFTSSKWPVVGSSDAQADFRWELFVQL